MENTKPAIPNASENQEIKELENHVRDLQVINKAKETVIEGMEKERDGFIDQLMVANRKVGELETKLLQLEQPHDQSG